MTNFHERKLERMVSSPDWNSRLKAAREPNLPESFIEKLLLDVNDTIVFTVLDQEGITPEMLVKLYEHKNKYTYYMALSHEKFPKEKIEQLIYDKTIQNEISMLANKRLPADILCLLLLETNRRIVARNINAHPNAPYKLSEEIAYQVNNCPL